VNSIGMDYDAVWQKNGEDHIKTGHGSVPVMSWNGEPFYGQDRFNQLFWRLRENGLTLRKRPREPLVTRPIRWPEGM
jgi:2-hydroxychromene-2-carboxylate isomerase